MIKQTINLFDKTFHRSKLECFSLSVTSTSGQVKELTLTMEYVKGLQQGRLRPCLLILGVTDGDKRTSLLRYKIKNVDVKRNQKLV
jgi:hypothetical protein